ncbi:LysR family transcriptional regulator [Aliiglaciecola sp. CAU 1673]|uniref:LysR family transcriptional regulator n=1 Tax=Aliiglaciecola sp. CAU 1673 TaxID=3032595 RepID=UPI0023D9BBCA|nr:LysR family transcriptional regulator [Aliiglaciecola sp. CAU 1673]MDF2179784.1 LysR family transcriptional regulator [Aliiglaciecola sp. CAU 1673]
MKHVTLKQLQAFVQLASSRSFAEAAERLHLSQPALSIAIKKFEEEVGGALLSRTTRSVELTQEGRNFLPLARRLLNDWDEALTDLHNLFAMQRGKLTVAAMPSFAHSQLAPVLKLFHQNYPKINISVLDLVMERAVEAVLDGRAELGIVFRPRQLQGLDFLPLFEDRFMVILGPTHPFCDKDDLHWSDLQGMDFVAMNRGSTVRLWCEERLQTQNISVQTVAEAGQLSTVGQLVASGLGLSLVPSLCQQDMLQRGLICRTLSGPALVNTVGVVSRSRGSLSVPAAGLLAQLQQTNWPAAHSEP